MKKLIISTLLVLTTLVSCSQSRHYSTLYFDEEVIVKCKEFPSFITDELTLQFISTDTSPYYITTEDIVTGQKFRYTVYPTMTSRRTYYKARNGRLSRTRHQY